MGYFDFVRQARGELERQRLSVLVLGSTYDDIENPYHTRELNDYLKRLGYDSRLVEENKEGDNHPEALPTKLLEMAEECHAIVVLVNNVGGVPTEIPIMVSCYPSKSFFFVREGDQFGKMIEGWLAGEHIVTHPYGKREELFEKVETCLKGYKLISRMRETVRRSLK